MRIVATAGHVDHGKSTLVRALTGMEPDRWDEERRRGLTIDLGFAWTTLDADDGERVTVAFVDVPGHERFIANMLAGAGGVTEALFVVAATDGWSTQSTEHLEVLDLLGVRAVAVVVTKVGLVDAARRREVVADVEARVAGTSLADAPVVEVDAVDGTGLDDLAGILATRRGTSSSASSSGRGRLWVDRSFVVDGAGTVVTGSWWGGSLAVGDTVLVLPDGIEARVRGLHMLGRSVEVATTGSRVAINLVGPSHREVGRGDAVVRVGPTPWTPTAEVEASIQTLPGREVGRTGAWHLHVGTAEVTARVAPLVGTIPGGQVGMARLELSRALPLRTGDRMVLRESGRRATVAGATVLDPGPRPRARGTEARLERAELLQQLDDARNDAERVRTLVDLHGGIRAADGVAAALGVADVTVDADVVRVAGCLVRADLAANWTARIVAAVADDDPGVGLAVGHAEEALRTSSCPPDLQRALVEHTVKAGLVVRLGPVLVLPDEADAHRRARRQQMDAVVAALEERPFTPPDREALLRDHDVDRGDLRGLVDRGVVVATGGLLFAATTVDEAVAALAGDLGACPFTASDARQVWATTRKYAVPLLEHLAATGRTTFDGHHHRLVAPA